VILKQLIIDFLQHVMHSIQGLITSMVRKTAGVDNVRSSRSRPTSVVAPPVVGVAEENVVFRDDDDDDVHGSESSA